MNDKYKKKKIFIKIFLKNQQNYYIKYRCNFLVVKIKCIRFFQNSYQSTKKECKKVGIMSQNIKLSRSNLIKLKN